MKSAIISALVGLFLGAANFMGFQTQLSDGKASGAPRSKMRLWRFLAWFDLIVFPAVGYYIPAIFKWVE